MQLSPRNLLGFRRLLAALTILLWASPGAADVTKVRLGVHDDRTRVVLDLNAPARYRLEPQTQADRIVITVEATKFAFAARDMPAGGLIRSMRVGEAAAEDGTTLIIELTGPAHVRQAQLLYAAGDLPPRIFIDLAPGSALPPAAAAPMPQQPEATIRPVQLASTEALAASDAAAVHPATAEPAAADLIPPRKPEGMASADRIGEMAAMIAPGLVPPEKPLVPAGGRLPVIVLDAGHGGKDPGAVGVNGTMEKDITLQMAKELKVLLERTGRYKVVLTREADELLQLRERIEIARAAKADLFISLHADHIEHSKLRGASVYTLSETASDAEAAALAARENKEDLIAGVDLSTQNAMVTSILIDLAQRETKNMSARFASMLTDELADRTLMVRNSHRFAGFVVLKAPDVPSVLVELGYLSNPEEEEALCSKEHRRALGRAMREAINRFFEWQRDVRRS
jgi:N-acetylmuramoyl-L-alanine amidase